MPEADGVVFQVTAQTAARLGLPHPLFEYMRLYKRLRHRLTRLNVDPSRGVFYGYPLPRCEPSPLNHSGLNKRINSTWQTVTPTNIYPLPCFEKRSPLLGGRMIQAYDVNCMSIRISRVVSTPVGRPTAPLGAPEEDPPGAESILKIASSLNRNPHSCIMKFDRYWTLMLLNAHIFLIACHLFTLYPRKTSRTD